MLNSKLTTPLGEIEILVDGKPYPYTAVPYTYVQPPVKDQPIEGCFRIFIPVTDCSEIICLLNPTIDKVEEGVESGGEEYECHSFQYQTIELVIGMVDDYASEHPRFVSERISRGVRYSKFSGCDEVIFGIAWTTDYFGDNDCRCWYAADPTLSGGQPL